MTQHVTKYYGPPGTGKTTKLMEIVEMEVRDNGVPLNRIGYFSFTKSAAEVIRDRMKAETNDMRWFRTIHGACVKALGLGGAIINGVDYATFSRVTKMKITPTELTLDEDGQGGMDYNVTLRALQMSATTLRPLDEVLAEMPAHPNLTRARVDAFSEAWSRYKAENHKVDFMDMLLDYDKVGQPLDIDVACIDEAQDLSELQWRVVRKMISRAKRVYIVGDDDQAIYTFIGGSEYGFLEFPADEEHVLTESHRVPAGIGKKAERVIRQINHRKDKAVQWQDRPGEVSVMNLDPASMPWKAWGDKYKDILVLTRHRKGAQDWSADLRAVGVAHALHGEGVHSWPEAKIAHAYFELKQGGDTTRRAAMNLIEAWGCEVRGFPGRGRIGKALVAGLGVDFEDGRWAERLGAANRIRARRYDTLKRLIRSEGHERLLVEPKLQITTMHGAKGREADLIIIDPACTGIVRRNLLTPTEIRLSYVALTRAKKQAVVLVPRTDNHIHHFFGI